MQPPAWMRPSLLLLWLISCLGPLQGATLERLSLNEIIDQSTDIVRARVAGSYTALRGSVIYTHYRLQVSDRWKGAAQQSMDIVVPGGAASGLRQAVNGAPVLVEGKEYLLFLWTGKQGLTWITGLTQGVFDLPKGASADSVAVRAASTERMLDRTTGRPVRDERIEMRMRDLSARISTQLGRSATR